MTNNITHISLLQHGEVAAGNVFCGDLETRLSSAGWKQLKQAFGKRKPDWDVVVTSPKAQCIAFAQWYAAKHKLPLVTDVRWREIHLGVWEGCHPSQLVQIHSDQLAQWWHNPASVLPDGGEDFSVFRERVLQAWSDLCWEWRGRRVLVVTHAGVIRLVVAHVLRIPDERLLSFNVEYGALTRLRVLHDCSGEWASLLTHGC